MRDPSHIMHDLLGYKHRLRLTSRHPIYHHLQNASEDKSKPIDEWRQMWDSKYNTKHFIEILVVDLPTEAHLPRPALFRLNRLHMGNCRFRSCLEKLGCNDDATCTCGEAPRNSRAYSIAVQNVNTPLEERAL